MFLLVSHANLVAFLVLSIARNEQARSQCRIRRLYSLHVALRALKNCNLYAMLAPIKEIPGQAE
jgi:hypothetical protein